MFKLAFKYKRRYVNIGNNEGGKNEFLCNMLQEYIDKTYTLFSYI